MSQPVRVVKRFSATSERVFDAWLDPAKARRFFFATPAGEMIRAEIDARVGGAFRFVDRRDGQDFAHVGRWLALERPRLLRFAFAVGLVGEPLSPETTVQIEIESLASGCQLTLTHEGVFAEYAERTEHGWSTMLRALEKTG